MRMPRRLRRIAARALWPATVALLCAWSLAPALWQADTAVKPDGQITRSPAVFVPSPPTLRHFDSLFSRKPFGRYLWNSAIVSGAATAVAVLFGALAAGALSGTATGKRRRALGALLAVSVFPPILLLFPLYEGVRALGWLNHPVALIVPDAALALPLCVWIFDVAFGQIPPEIDEAARLDGLSPLSRVLRIRLPLAAPAAATATILSFIFCWNEFLLALTFATRDRAKTVTAGIASVGGSSLHEIPWGQLSAAILVATTPLVILVLVFERRITAGLSRGAVKG